METEISKSKFKAHALEIFRRVEQTGVPVVITDHGAPTLVIKKYTCSQSAPSQRLVGSVLHYHQPLAPVAEDDWDALA